MTRGRGAPALIVLVLAGVQFLVVLDSLGVSLAVPAIAADLSVGAAAAAGVLTAFSLALAAGLLLGGRLSDRWGRREVLLAGLALLSLGAVLAAGAQGLESLIAARVLQGIGAALAYPPVLSLTAECFPNEPWRSRAFAAGAVAGASGAVAGAGFGGVVSGALGWPWVFSLTIAPGVGLFALAWQVLPRRTGGARGTARGAARDLDLTGALLGAGALAALLLLSTRVVAYGSLDPASLGLGGAVVLLGVGFVIRERTARHPLVPPALAGSPRLWGGCLGIAANSGVYSVVVLLVALHLQTGSGLSAGAAGLAFVPVSLTSVLAGVVVVGPVRRRLGSVWTGLLGLALGLAAVLLLAAAPERASYVAHVLPAFLLAGPALTLASVSLTEHTLGAPVDPDRGVRAGLFETSTHLGGSVAVSVSSAALAAGAGSTGQGGYRTAYLATAALISLAAAASAGLLLRDEAEKL